MRLIVCALCTLQIIGGGETIHSGGLAVNDGGVVIKSPIGDILALYIRASGSYVASALTIDGLTVRHTITRACTHT